MNHTTQHSAAWVTFTYISFAASAFMVGIGIWLLPLDLSIKGYLTMGFLMLVQSCITMTKTMRDMHESDTPGEPHRGRQGRAPADGSFQGGVSAATSAARVSRHPPLALRVKRRSPAQARS